MFDDILGLEFISQAKKLLDINVPDEIKNLALLRWQAKQEKNYARADELKKQIIDSGFVIEDKKDGYEIKKA